MVLPILIAGALLAILAWFRFGGQVKNTTAVQLLKQGATIVDVRTEEEYQTDHIPSAMNVPLNHLSRQAPGQFPRKDTVLLLHCLGGGRSLIGRSMLKRLGYTRVYNLGSVTRARTLWEQSRDVQSDRTPADR